jgi:hypothetical protein
MSEQGFDMGHHMDDGAGDAAGETGESVGRRQVLKRGAAGAAAAWAVPVIVTLAASPAGATSEPPTTGSTGNTQPPESTQPTSGETQPTTGETEPTSGRTQGITVTTGSTQTAQVPPTSATTTTTRQAPGSAVAVGAQSGANPSAGLAFTGAEIGGLVVLGAGAVALGTAAVWTARHRDEQDDPDSPAPAVG